MLSSILGGFSLGLAVWVVAYLLNRSWLGFKSLIS